MLFLEKKAFFSYTLIRDKKNFAKILIGIENEREKQRQKKHNEND